jgi:hypothetical protein
MPIASKKIIKTHNDRQPVTPKVGAGTNAEHRKVSGSEMGQGMLNGTGPLIQKLPDL